MRIGNFSVVVADATATRALKPEEWAFIADKVEKIDLDKYKYAKPATLGMIVHHRIHEIYKVIKRDNIPVADKRRVIMYLTNGG